MRQILRLNCSNNVLSVSIGFDVPPVQDEEDDSYYCPTCLDLYTEGAGCNLCQQRR